MINVSLRLQALNKYRWIDFPINLAVLVLYLGIAKISLLFSIRDFGVTIFWPPGGFALALLLLAGPKYLPGIFAGAFAAGILVDGSIAFSAWTALGNSLETLCGYWLLSHYRHINHSLENPKDLFQLLFYGAFVSTIFSALIGPATLFTLDMVEASLLPAIILRWWMADILGIAFMTPLILIWHNWHQQIRMNAAITEIVILFVLTFITGQAIFFNWSIPLLGDVLSIAWLIPFIIWSGLRVGKHNTAILQLMIFIQALWSASIGIGHYADDMAQSGLVNFWVFGMLISVGGMVIAVISAKSRQLQEQWHQLYQSISSSVNEIYLFHADSLQFFFVNKGAQENLGYAMEDLLLMTPLDLSPLHNDQSLQKLVEPLLQHETSSLIFETVNKRKNGSLYPVEMHLQLIDKDQKPYFQAITLDITERKQNEQAKLDNEERLRLVIKATNDGIWDWNTITHEDHFSPRWKEILGYQDEELPNIDSSFFELIHPDDKDAVVDAVTHHFEDHVPFNVEIRMRHKNGAYCWILSRGEAIRDAAGRPVRMVGSITDITERKAAESREKSRGHILEMVATGVALPKILEAIIISIEHANPEMICSILLTNQSGKNLLNGASPSLPAFYTEAINGISIGLGVGPCGTAVYTGKRVIVEDIQNHPYWAPYKELAAKAKLGACWSEPIRSTQDDIVGTFAIYHHDSRQPTETDILLINKTAHLVSIAIEKVRAEEKLQLAASVFSHAREGIMITDSKGAIVEVNDTFSQITGYDREEVLGKNPRIFHSGRQSSEFYTNMWSSLLEQHHWYGEVWNRRKNGEVYPEMLTISAVRDSSGTTQNYVSLFSDITSSKEHQQQLEHIAHYDVLTNLPNRLFLADRMQQAMNQSLRRKDSIGIVYLDLDGFKVINDTYGHEVGDELLICVSKRMKTVLRDGDTLARIGGDEFVAVLVDLNQVIECEPLLDRLLQAAAAPVIINNIEMQVSASIGVTFYPEDNADVDLLMRHADQAMYIAKQSGKNRYHVFNVQQDSAIKIQRESLDRIRCAMDHNEFVLYYQPKVNMQTGKVIGAEALIRWEHPERGLIPPAEFLPIIENHSLSVDLGSWVIDTALAQISEWQNAGVNIQVSVNIGARQLQQQDFVAQFMALLAKYSDVKPCNLELEILETSALEDITDVSAIMHKCNEIGVKFALDDFGTGYSSLTYLKRLPADLLKIDQSFVRDMLDDPDDLAIVNGVIGLAIAFRRQVIAEGVETIEHGTKLLSLGCVLAQGYGIARPMPAAKIPNWVATWQPDAAWKK